jgi:hypothetical protein
MNCSEKPWERDIAAHPVFDSHSPTLRQTPPGDMHPLAGSAMSAHVSGAATPRTGSYQIPRARVRMKQQRLGRAGTVKDGMGRRRNLAAREDHSSAHDFALH